MGAGMSRFVLLAAALHVGVLAALGLYSVRPPLLPATLTVTLVEAPAAPTSPPHHRGAPPPRIHRPDQTKAPSPEPAREATLSAASPNQLQPSPRPSAENDPADTILPHPESVAELPRKEAQPLPDPQALDTDATLLVSQLESQLRDALAPYFAYPMLARRNGWQGQVQVGLRVEANGRLSQVRLAHSSGHRLLDSAALATLHRIEILPQAAGWLGGRHFDMVLPVEYQLVGG